MALRELESTAPLKEASPELAAATDRSGGTTGGTAQFLPEGLEIQLGEVLA